MSGPDRTNIRRAVDQFQPQRRSRFQNLVPWRDEILMLREKGASCEAIAELLTQHGVRTSRTMVGQYLATQTGTKPRRKSSLRPIFEPRRAAPEGESAPPTPDLSPRLPARPKEAPPSDSTAPKPRGPRIAQVELIKPNDP